MRLSTHIVCYVKVKSNDIWCAFSDYVSQVFMKCVTVVLIEVIYMKASHTVLLGQNNIYHGLALSDLYR